MKQNAIDTSDVQSKMNLSPWESDQSLNVTSTNGKQFLKTSRCASLPMQIDPRLGKASESGWRALNRTGTGTVSLELSLWVLWGARAHTNTGQ